MEKTLLCMLRVKTCAHVAQLDRALGYGPRCREFESSRVRDSVRIAQQTKTHECQLVGFLSYVR